MSPESHLQALHGLQQKSDELKRFMDYNFNRLRRNSKILEVITFIAALVIFVVWLAEV